MPLSQNLKKTPDKLKKASEVIVKTDTFDLNFNSADDTAQELFDKVDNFSSSMKVRLNFILEDDVIIP